MLHKATHFDYDYEDDDEDDFKDMKFYIRLNGEPRTHE